MYESFRLLFLGTNICVVGPNKCSYHDIIAEDTAVRRWCRTWCPYPSPFEEMGGSQPTHPSLARPPRAQKTDEPPQRGGNIFPLREVNAPSPPRPRFIKSLNRYIFVPEHVSFAIRQLEAISTRMIEGSGF